jgi:hypothetical protein
LFADRPAARRSASETALNASGVSSPTARPQAAEDGLRRAAGKLVKDDRTHEGGERPIRNPAAGSGSGRRARRDRRALVARRDLVDRSPKRAPRR